MVQPTEPEFEQAYSELLLTLEDSTLFDKKPHLKAVLPVVSIPERTIMFRVVWQDDKGQMQVNRGYRVQFNSALGPYKGGLRFHPSVNLSILKFLGYEQIFKNALTGLSIGGGKGGADFDPKGKSDGEIRRFCEAFMRELSRHIDQDTDVPAGDIGVGGREIGFLFGAFRRYRNSFQGVLTGKGLTWGGSLIRPEATGYGLVYYVEKMLEYASLGTFAGKIVAVSGSGNVAQYAALKAIELGATVVSLSDSKGAYVAKGAAGFSAEEISLIADVKLNRLDLYSLDDKFKAKFDYYAGARPWTLIKKIDIALPSATQNEVSAADAEALIRAGCKIIAEGSNMGSTMEAIEIFEKARTSTSDSSIWYAPGKAANCGGVAVSGLEMAQNSQRISWSTQEVDQKLKEIMINCFENCLNTSITYSSIKDEKLPSLVKGANIAGFIKVAEAMLDQGDFY
ncbi:Glutamate/Leucine/Phenylalanine/Valine dehydrogenase-domain-containing protein [Lipomyces oligophaga]|uniref:Glutamate/Leucine/Phenylalanine/Valine dehydrogenase-domain-containing protein n=1 Tax=Lipomyces oligophaga TaxID=45792 RepID=UPI0034CE87AF